MTDTGADSGTDTALGDTGLDTGFDTSPDTGPIDDDIDDGAGPSVAFEPPETAIAGAPVGFAATSPDGALTYTWDFDDTHLGGGPALAHVFEAAGTYTIRLTAADSQGRQASVEHDLTVDSGEQIDEDDVGALTLNGHVADVDGAAIESAEITVEQSGVDGQTDAQGHVELAGLDADSRLVIRVQADGFVDQIVTVETLRGAKSAQFDTRLLPGAASQTLTDVQDGASADGVDGLRLQVPANGLVDADGQPVSGDIDARMTPVDISGDQIVAFPGGFRAVMTDATPTPILSYGAAEFTLSQNGAPVQLAAGKHATIDVPIYVGQDDAGNALADGDTIPLWSLDESSGIWVQEGAGEVVSSAASPSGWAMQATVGHFTWWNCDIGFEAHRVNPLPRLRDDDGDPTIPIDQDQTALIRGQSTADGLPRSAATVHVGPNGVDGDDDALPVPADRDVRLVAYAQNGTLRGEVVANGPAGELEDVVVPLGPIDTGGDGEAVTLPVDREASLDSLDDTDRYTFSADAGDIIHLKLGAAPTSTLRSRISLYRKGGVRLKLANYDPTISGVTGSITQKIPATGDYVIAVDALYDAPGGYSLKVHHIEEVSVNTNISGTFEEDKKLRVYAFEGSADAIMTVGLADSSYTSAAIDTLDGEQLVNSSDRVTTLPSDGSYILRVTRTLRADDDFEVGLPTVESQALSFTDAQATVSNAIDVLGDWQVYTLTGDPDDGLAVELQPSGSTPLPMEGREGVLVERVGNGTLDLPDQDITDVGYYQRNDLIDAYLAKLSGDAPDTQYTIVVRNPSTGGYDLKVDLAAHDADITVDDDLSCSGATTSSVPAALQAVDSGGTVTVCDGDYRHGVDALMNTDGVTLAGASRNGATLDTGGFAALNIRADDTTVRNLVVEQDDVDDINSHGIYIDADNVVIEDVTIQSPDPTAPRMDSGIEGRGANPTYQNLTIRDAFRAIDQFNRDTPGGRIAGCNIDDVTQGVWLHSSGYTIDGNTITAADERGSAVGIYAIGDGLVVDGNDITLDQMNSSDASSRGVVIENEAEPGTSTIVRANTINFSQLGERGETLGVSLTIGRQGATSDVLVENNDITLNPTNGGTGVKFAAGGAITLTIQNNVIRHLGDEGISLGRLDSVDHVGIYNNTFRHNLDHTYSGDPTEHTFRMGADNSSPVTSLPIDVVNNIFEARYVTAAGFKFQLNGGGSPTIDSDYNLWFGYDAVYAAGGTSTGGAELIGQDPGFQGITSELSSSSPAIDAGAGTAAYPNLPTTDIDGTARPTGGGVDMGAYEQ